MLLIWKSRVNGDVYARFCERLGLKRPSLLEPVLDTDPPAGFKFLEFDDLTILLLFS